MSFTTATTSKIRHNGLTIFRRLIQSSSSTNSQYSQPTFNRCICSHHRNPVKQGKGNILEIEISATLVRPYHSSKSNPIDRKRDALTRNSSADEEIDGDEAKTAPFRSTAPGTIQDNFVPYEDQSRVIQDVQEQEWNPIPNPMFDPQAYQEPVNLERGQTGVFDLEELVELLREQNARDTCVIAIPKEMKYADHMVVVTARSPKHMFALATFIRRRFKMKQRKESDILPKIEGSKTNKDWIALDLGNIALHIFTSETREKMDLETLWTVGPLFDDLVNTKDPQIVQLLNLFSSNNPPPGPGNKSKK